MQFSPEGSPLNNLHPKSFRWVGGGGGVESDFSVLLWAKPLVLALAQAEQL